MKLIGKYLLAIFFLAFFALESSYCMFLCMSQPLHQELITAINKKKANYILMKRRTPCGPLSLNKAFCVFALLDKILGGDGFSKEQKMIINSAELAHTCLDRFDPEIEEIYSIQNTTEDMEKIQFFLDNLKNNLAKFNDKKWTFIVFSEMFFSSTHALDTQSIQGLLGYCSLLTRRYERLIVVVNFLHAFNNEVRPHWMPHNFSTIPLSKDFIDGPSDKLMIRGRRNCLNHLANYSLVFWKGMPISCYRKTTYCNENNALIDQKEYAYEFGDFESYEPFSFFPDHKHNFQSGHKQIGLLFNDKANRSIVTRVCADSIFMPNLQLWEKLLLLSANGCPSVSGWMHKIPKDIACCLVDGEGVADSFLTKTKVKLPQTVEESSQILQSHQGLSTILQKSRIIRYDCKYMQDELQCSIYTSDGGYYD